MEMPVSHAQRDMRQGYYSGAAGVLASALAWTLAAVTAGLQSDERAILVLLVAGMFIHPVGLLFCRVLGASGAHTKGNPLGLLAGASTFWLVFSLPIAYAAGLTHAAWFFCAMLLTIGGRYLVFGTVYGMRLYWVLGLTLALAGIGLVWLRMPAWVAVSCGAALELAFGAAAVVQHRQWARLNHGLRPAGESA